MGEAFYAFLVDLFTNPSNHHLGPERIVSSTLTGLGMFFAYMWLSGTLLWFTRKSVLISRTLLVYLFAAFIGMCGIGHLGHVLSFPVWVQLSVEFLAAALSLVTAYILWHRRHFIISIVYQFKYVIGLLKTLEKLDEVDTE